ncbi:MAG: SpoVR family protein [Bacteroidetes bacterium]|jgi:stage V sporulation protein R|nr:SpoVR family protein [Bacteroidota bacterium]MBT6685012.1 SpoVR family protein [Bacteroidota bacterium]MBT7143090.1 SpoVR family protein [Bacteroidota bacterium]MBT7491497.1 SpoVR family protein [Bacteroidota bacterium]
MQLIDQNIKRIMEGCKERARDAGLQFDNESLEYIVSNKDMINLSPKVMIPTLYDYWVQDIEVLKGHGQYEVYPHNPFETVINSRPAISFYNDNNPDWMNIMIFYHVLGHIDFFQNNKLFQNTWDDDFVGQALADKRLIAQLRSKHGRWVDYIIEFSRSIDNIIGFYSIISKNQYPQKLNLSAMLNFYFDHFLQVEKKLSQHEIYREIERYNKISIKFRETAESVFFDDVKNRFPEFIELFRNHSKQTKFVEEDLLQYLLRKSPFLNKSSNVWMKSVVNIVRETALYFSPQIRTKTINEGWASYWHDELFRKDDRIAGHEISYAKLNASVTSLSRIGLNPYAIGLRLFQHIENLAEKGKMSYKFEKIKNISDRQKYNKKTGKGKSAIFRVREEFSDFTLFNTYISQDFVDEYGVFITGKRLNSADRTIEYYIKSRKAEEYKKMLIDSLYHPPHITVNHEKTTDKNLFLEHHFEGKSLYNEFIPDTLLGIEYLWGGSVQLQTTEIQIDKKTREKTLNKFIYTMKERKIEKVKLS